MRKPVIGIVASHSPLLKINHPERTVTHISDEIRQAIIDIGGIPIGILPPAPEICFVTSTGKSQLITSSAALGGSSTSHQQDAMEGRCLQGNPDDPFYQRFPITAMAAPGYRDLLYEQLHLCDGIVFQGGIKVDKYAYHLAHIAYHGKIPSLGFCSGQTVMAGIFEDTKMVNVDEEIHRQPELRCAHEISVVSNSQFYKMVGRCSHLRVNSRHTTAIAACPALYTAAIYTGSDGTHSEVLEPYDDDQFYLSTRFHPESIYRGDKAIQGIFKAFINAAYEYQGSSFHF